MRKSLILSLLVLIGLCAPALAGEHHGEQRIRSIQQRVDRFEQGPRSYAMHDRRKERYRQHQHRMDNLRHSWRDKRRLEGRAARWYGPRKVQRHEARRTYSATVVSVSRRQVLPPVFPSIVVRIPLNW